MRWTQTVIPTLKETPAEAESIEDLWDRAKLRIVDHEIQDSHLSKWFAENFGISVRLVDFGARVPPDKFTSAMLSFFCEFVDLHCSLQ